MNYLTNKIRHTILLGSCAILLLFVSIRCKNAQDEVVPAPKDFQIPPLTGDVPLQVNLPANFNGTPVNARPFFDIFSWEMFIALNWPQDGDKRGVPKDPLDENTFLSMTNTTPTVWTSYKNQFDLFGQKNERPTPWDSWDNKVHPCNEPEPIKHVFGTSKSSTLDGAEVDEAFSYPLIDQEKNYTLYEMRYNKEQYNFVRGEQNDPSSWLYLKKNLVNKWIETKDSIVMPESSAPDTKGALMVKAAWKEMTDRDSIQNYYVINEKIYDPTTGSCTTKKMGLVGLHLVQKLKGFEQWIWSSFEHRNNIPGQGSQKPYSYFNVKDSVQTPGGWAYRPTSLEPVDPENRTPTQVTKLKIT